jgi:hypothetical protein
MLALGIYPSQEGKVEPLRLLAGSLNHPQWHILDFANKLDFVDFVKGILPFRAVQHTESITWKGDNRYEVDAT